ncbi:MAG: hypothetical protein HRU12_17515 [Phaeodactylibacter sp.]|nr:hypothetical protein [Phaeodactylibacter sp.]
MKNLIIFFVALIISAGYTYAQSPYEAGMQQAFSLWEEGKDLEALAFFESVDSSNKCNSLLLV